MSAASTSEALATAFRIKNGDESASRVKAIVADTLLEADRNVVVVQTRCFNHTYVPDMVLEWPRRGVNAIREVYLRPSDDPERLKTDVEQHRSRPMFVHLANLDRKSRTQEKHAFDQLSDAARTSSSLVTEIGALAQLSTGETPATQILPPSILRGGVGLLDEDAAVQTARVVDAGFAGALQAERPATALALEAIEEVLDTPSANELSTFIETMWIASGGDPMSFPGFSHDLGSRMPPGRLQALLEAVSDDTDDFWRKIGTSIEIESFAGLDISREHRALQSLVASALSAGTLRAHACRINTVANSDKSGEFHWQVDNGILSLNGKGFRASLGLRKEDLPKYEQSDESSLPTPGIIARRALRGTINLRQVEYIGNGRVLSLRSVVSDDGIASAQIGSSFDDTLGPDPRATAGAALIGSKFLDLEFDRLTAAGRTVARFSASSLLWASWMMLTDETDGGAAELRDALWPDGHAAADNAEGEPQV